MIEPLDRHSCAFRLIAERFPQKVDKPVALFDRLLSVSFLTNLRAIFFARHRADIDVVLHRSPLSEKL
jgi:hypothetical protein